VQRAMSSLSKPWTPTFKSAVSPDAPYAKRAYLSNVALLPAVSAPIKAAVLGSLRPDGSDIPGGRSRPQYRHTTASPLMISAQNGHFRLSLDCQSFTVNPRCVRFHERRMGQGHDE